MELSDELAIVNAVIPHAAHGKHRNIRLDDPLLRLSEAGLDSMDVAVLGAYLCELFDVPPDLHRSMPGDTVHHMFEHLRLHGRRQIQHAHEVDDLLAP